MFRGNFVHNINGQGRVSLPARFRQVLDERYSSKLVLVGGDSKIEAFPEESYRKVEEADMQLALDDPEVADYLLLRHNNVWEVETDSQGRILLPPKLRSDFGLEKEVVIIGMMDRIYIYEPGQYEKDLSRAAERREQAAKKVARMRQGLSGD